MDTASTFAERLAYARWWRSGTIRRESDLEFAALLGVSGPAVSQWRERVEPLEVSRVEKLAELCQVPFDWLLRGERSDATAPNLFTPFLAAYRDWVARGGLQKQRVPTDTMSAAQRRREERADVTITASDGTTQLFEAKSVGGRQESAKTRALIYDQKTGDAVPLGRVAEDRKAYGGKTAPIATGFQKMSSKQLEAEKKKGKRKKA